MTEQEQTQDIEISNPILGRLAARGVRISDLIALLTFVVVLATAVLVWQASEAGTRHTAETADVNKAIAGSIKQSASAQRLMTCIISLPQERREQEFTQPNSFCQRMSSLP